MNGSYWPKIIISYPCGSILNHRWFLSFTRHAHIQFKSNTSLNEIFCTGGELFERSINGSCPSLYNPQTASAETLLKEAKTQRANYFSIICPDRLYVPVMENSSLLFSSCHLELVISGNSQCFACYLSK